MADVLEKCPSCGDVGNMNPTTAAIRCCISCGRDVTPIRYVSEAEATARVAQERQAQEALVERWRIFAQSAADLAKEYASGSAGSGHAFRKEQRIWTTCAAELECVLKAYGLESCSMAKFVGPRTLCSACARQAEAIEARGQTPTGQTGGR